MNHTQGSLIGMVADVIEPFVARNLGVQVEVRQAFLPNTVQPNSLLPTIWIYPGLTRNHGFKFDTVRPDPLVANMFEVDETQVKETTLHLYGTVPSNDGQGPTTLDVVNMAAMACQSNAMVAAAIKAGGGILRVTEIQDPIPINEFERFEPSPAFTVTLTHRLTVTDQLPAVQEGPIEVYPI